MYSYTIDRYEPHIMLVKWSGLFNLDSILIGTQDRIRFADEHQNEPYILIIDILDAEYNLFEMRAARNAADADQRAKGVIMISDSYGLQVVSRIVNKIPGVQIHVTNTLEHAITLARKLVQKFPDKLDSKPEDDHDVE